MSTTSFANVPPGLTLTILGCGTMGIAILSGILSSTEDTPSTLTSSIHPQSAPLPPPSRFIACVRSSQSAARIRSSLSKHLSSITILQDDNLIGVKAASVVLLACKPSGLSKVLGARGISDALKGKLLISILAGVTVERLQETLHGFISEAASHEPCRIICAIPNIAALVRSSITVITEPSPPLSQENSAIISWIFTRIGDVKFVNTNAMSAATVLCAAGPAFAATFLEALASGAEAMGIGGEEAIDMAAKAIKGMAELVINGEHPDMLRKKVATPGGVTIEGLRVLVEGGIREVVIEAVGKATNKTERVGQS
ncbi:pyrroline-5-carboxylate reductase [Trichophaea hybrida]|nr:pyrroline-5-carboxylate reductase [Trichophaea hybrida]